MGGLKASVRTVRTNIEGLRLQYMRIHFCGILFAVSVVMSSLGVAGQVMKQPVGIPATQGDTLGIRPPVSGAIDRTNGSYSQASSLGMVLPAESLGNDDLLEMTVPYCPELSGKFRIGSDGKLALPLLPRPIQAAGLTPAQVAARIKEALIGEQIMADPSVNIAVLEYRSRTVIVLGAVLHPLTFQATGETTLLDAIATAGGLSPNVGTNIVVVSPHVTPQGTREKTVQTIPVQELFVKADPIYNLALHGGEEIRVSETGKVFVAGNVIHPGMYAMQGDADTTVLKALALSQGLQSYSTKVAYIYRRAASGGERQEIPVPLSRIIARKERDVSLISDDILYVPEARGKRMTAKVLNQIAGFGQTTAAGLLIYK
jgi:polysaccharide biosynthesis/export protein